MDFDLQLLFTQFTKGEMPSRIMQGKKSYNKQAFKGFKIEFLENKTKVSCFVKDFKKKAIYSTSCLCNHFPKDLLDTYNQKFTLLMKNKSISYQDIQNFEEFFLQKFREEVIDNSKNLFENISCDCYEQKSKSYCHHFYVLLSALFAIFEYSEETLYKLKGIKSDFSYSSNILEDNGVLYENKEPFDFVSFYGKEIPANLTKKILSNNIKGDKNNIIEYKCFKKEFYDYEAMLNNLFSECLKGK